MELDQQGTTSQHAHKTSETTSISSDGASGRSHSSSVAAGNKNGPMNHDSLVTVRLSEPPSLHVNTTLPSSSLPNRKSLYGADDSPSDVIAEEREEEEDEDGASDGQDPKTPASDRGLPSQEEGLSLQEELDNMDDEDEEFEESHSSASTARSSAGSEAVNWEQLQKKEDQESKDQDSDNVRSPQLCIFQDVSAN